MCAQRYDVKPLQAEDAETKLREVRKALQADQQAHADVQKASAADKEDLAKQGAALVEMGKQVWHQGT